MTRREWLAKFIGLCDTDASTLDFRRYCRVKAQHLPRHIKRLLEYRKEFAVLQAVEDEENRKQAVKESRLKALKKARLKALEEARRVKTEQAAQKRAELESQSPSDNEPDVPKVS